MPRVLIIDDDPVVLEVVQLILTHAGYDVVTAESGVLGLEAVRGGAIDVAVTDLQMPGISGFEMIRLLQGLDPTLPVVVLTANASLESAIAAMRHAGAFDFLEKPITDPRAFELAIAQAFVHRERLLTAAGLSIPPERQGAAKKLAQLTHRERELLELLAQGLDNQEIANRTHLSQKTVRNYLSALYAKLGVENRTRAVLLLSQAGN